MLRDLWQSLIAAMGWWHQGKLFIEHSVGIEHGTLHVLVGIFTWLVLALFLRRPITSGIPYLWLLALIVGNETVDLWTERWPDPGMQYGEGTKDVILTMIAPSV